MARMARNEQRDSVTSDRLVESVLAQVMEYCHLAQIRPTTFGRLAVNDSFFVRRLVSRRVKLSTIAKVQDYIRKHPPRAGAA